MKALLLAVLCTIGQTDEYAQDFHHDFRGAPLPDELARLPGNAPGMTVEEEGLRITLRKDRKKLGQVGVCTTFPVKGDFEITAAYEILHADQPSDGWGVGATLYVFADEPGKDAAGVYRLNKIKGAQTVYWDCAVIGADGKRRYSSDRITSDAKLLRLRMTRKKQTLTFFWAPGLEGDGFRELGTTDFVSHDLQAVALNTTTGSKPYDLDVRFLDLRIRSTIKSLSEPARSALLTPAGVDRVGRRWRLLLVVVLLGVAIFAGFLTLRLRQRLSKG